MVRILADENLKQMFRQRFLAIHDPCLKSLSDIIATSYYGAKTWQQQCFKMLQSLMLAGDSGVKLTDAEDSETSYFRNLRNGWYHEFAVSRIGPEIAAWKIVQAYYAVFSSISSIIRCLKPEIPIGHKPILRSYTQEFVNNEKRKAFVLPPTNLLLKSKLEGQDSISWPYGLKHHVPNIEAGLRWTRDHATTLRLSAREVITVPIYMLALREWVNYSDPYLFMMLYGPTIKEKLDSALENIVFLYLAQAEYFLTLVFGWPAVSFQFETFIHHMKDKIGERPSHLEARYDAFSALFENGSAQLQPRTRKL